MAGGRERERERERSKDRTQKRAWPGGAGFVPYITAEDFIKMIIQVRPGFSKRFFHILYLQGSLSYAFFLLFFFPLYYPKQHGANVGKNLSAGGLILQKKQSSLKSQPTFDPTSTKRKIAFHFSSLETRFGFLKQWGVMTTISVFP